MSMLIKTGILCWVAQAGLKMWAWWWVIPTRVQDHSWVWTCTHLCVVMSTHTHPYVLNGHEYVCAHEYEYTPSHLYVLISMITRTCKYAQVWVLVSTSMHFRVYLLVMNETLQELGWVRVSMPIYVAWRQRMYVSICFAVVVFVLLNKIAAAFGSASVISKMLPLALVEYVGKKAHFLERTSLVWALEALGSFTESFEFLSLDETAESLSLCKVIPWPSH